MTGLHALDVLGGDEQVKANNAASRRVEVRR
jgi:hypothetical protein